MRLYLNEATDILVKTFPYVAIRMLVYLIFGILSIAYFGLLFVIGSSFEGGGILAAVMIAGTIGFYWIFRLAREYFLYLLKAGHVAVITELVISGSLPDGINQVDYGKQRVISLFKEVSVLFVVDRLVNAVLRSFTRWTLRIAHWLPIPGLAPVARFAGKMAELSIGFVDEAILSYTIAKKQANMWEGAREGVILFCQQWKPILLNAAVMALISYVSFFAILLPGVGIAMAFQQNEVARIVVLLVFGLLAIVVKFGLVNPLALISTIVTFQRAVEGVVPDPAWEARLDGISGKFREIKDRARGWAPGPASTPAGS